MKLKLMIAAICISLSNTRNQLRTYYMRAFVWVLRRILIKFQRGIEPYCHECLESAHYLQHELEAHL